MHREIIEELEFWQNDNEYNDWISDERKRGRDEIIEIVCRLLEGYENDDDSDDLEHG